MPYKTGELLIVIVVHSKYELFAYTGTVGSELGDDQRSPHRSELTIWRVKFNSQASPEYAKKAVLPEVN